MAVLKAVIGVVEDDPALQELLVEELEAEGYQVDAWGSLEDFKNSNASPDPESEAPPTITTQNMIF